MGLHARLHPRNYLEIGVDKGVEPEVLEGPVDRCRPRVPVPSELRTDVYLVRDTSDRFFARRDPLRYLGGGRNPWRNLRHNRPLLGRLAGRATVDLAFIDGMHWFEFALRDFMNIERHSSATTVIVFDDMLPRNVIEAARDRTTGAWTGDVFRLDLGPARVSARPHRHPGRHAADRPAGRPWRRTTRAPSCSDHYDEIVAANVRPDPQAVPTVDPRTGAGRHARGVPRDGSVADHRPKSPPASPASRVRNSLRHEVAPLLARGERGAPPGDRPS